MPSKNKSNPLQRGSACLCCRKRKMRCDGVRPACTQCVKADRIDLCDYDDQHRKSRTQILQEKVLSLENKLRRLEAASSPSGCASSHHAGKTNAQNERHNTQLYTMDDPSDQQFGFSTGDFPPAFSHQGREFGDLHGPFYGPTPVASPEFVFDFLQPIPRHGSQTADLLVPDGGIGDEYRSRASTHYTFDVARPTGLNHALFDGNNNIFEIFLSHQHQCGFDLDIGRFQLLGRAAPHPSLINAIYLIGYYFSQSPCFAEAEAYMLGETLSAIAAGIQHSDRLVDVVSASCLVAFYHYVNGQVVEGYRHCFTAVRLAITLGLHQLCKDPHSTHAAYAPIPPVQNSSELRDRISVFWQVYEVDRSWSVVNHLPTALPDDHSSESLQIKTPWPQPAKSFTQMEPLFSMYGEPKDDKPFMPALRAEAVGLYERAYRLSTLLCDKGLFTVKRQEIEHAVDNFASTIPRIAWSEPWRPQPSETDVDLVIIHAMVNVAYIYLRKDCTGIIDATSERCLAAAHAVSTAVRQLKEEDYDYLDPIISACWKEVGELYIYLLFECDKISGRAREMHIFARELNLMILALRKFGRVFAIASQHAEMLEQMRAERCSRPGKTISI